MRRNFVIILGLLLVFVPVALFASGTQQKAQAAKQPVTITWYMPGGTGFPYSAAQPVYAAVNAKLEKDLGIKLNIQIPGAFGEFNTKMPLLMSAGTPFDLVFTSDWCNSFINAVGNGFYAPLNSLLPQNAPTLYKELKSYLPAVTINGNIYGVWNQQIAGFQSEIIYRDSDLKKFNWDYKTITNVEQIEPLLAKIKANEPGVIPVSTRDSLASWMVPYMGYVMLSVTPESILAVRDNDPNMKVVNLWEQPDYLHYVQLERQWYLKGYVAKDGLTYSNDQWQQLYNSGRIAVDFHDGGYDSANNHPSYAYGNATAYWLGPAETDTENITSTLQAVSANSKHKADAIKVLEYLETHPDVYNMLVWGLPNKNYTTNSDGTITPLKNSGYYTNIAWAYGDAFNSLLLKGQPLDANKITRQWNAQTFKANILGFNVNVAPIKNLIASVSAVAAQYKQLGDGYYDLTTQLPKYQAALKAAGIDQLIQQIQGQIDAWRKANGK